MAKSFSWRRKQQQQALKCMPYPQQFLAAFCTQSLMRRFFLVFIKSVFPSIGAYIRRDKTYRPWHYSCVDVLDSNCMILQQQAQISSPFTMHTAHFVNKDGDGPVAGLACDVATWTLLHQTESDDDKTLMLANPCTLVLNLNSGLARTRMLRPRNLDVPFPSKHSQRFSHCSPTQNWIGHVS